ncbi:Ubiquitin protein ligase E3 component n-recognin 4 [Cichlidogyrus casuarinus]|uniref:Ubiquitin protein ligase E3 component n-recognin 4 n=1 Tax=Cichlidogyrus casuarinus TaxID=1844966 RepID=A0ABD2QL08_9PLAT
MAQSGMIFSQRLEPNCLIASGQFYLADSLDWDQSLLPTPGGNGGASLHYHAGRQLLLHSYQCGHSVATRISFEGARLLSVNSFLLAKTSQESKKQASDWNPFSGEMTSFVQSVTSLMDKDQVLKSGSTQQEKNELPLLAEGTVARWKSVPGNENMLCAFTALQSKAVQQYHLQFDANQIQLSPVCVKTAPLPRTATQDADKKPIPSGPIRNNEKRTPPNKKGGVHPNSLLPPRVIDAYSVQWERRTLTVSLTADGQLYLNSTDPTPSEVEQVLLPVTNLPQGPLWKLHPGTESKEAKFQKMFMSAKSDESGSEEDEDNEATWRVVLNSHKKKRNGGKASKSSLNRHLLDRPSDGVLSNFLLEYARESDKVTFGGQDLLQVYNPEQLKTLNFVTGLGKSITVSSSKSMNMSSDAAASPLAFVLKVSVPSDYIVGLQVTLPSQVKMNEGTVKGKGENMRTPANRWPKYFLICGRRVNVPAIPATQTESIKVNLPLYRHEISKCERQISLGVGLSSDQDGLTSIGRVRVFIATAQEAGLNAQHLNPQPIEYKVSQILQIACDETHARKSSLGRPIL